AALVSPMRLSRTERVKMAKRLRLFLPPHEPGAPVSDPARWGLVYRKPRRVGDRRSVQGHTARTSAGKSLLGERAGVRASVSSNSFWQLGRATPPRCSMVQEPGKTPNQID